MDKKEAIGKRIAHLRYLNEMTQSQLSGLAHVARTSVLSWENGKNYPSPESVKRLAEIFHVTSDYILNLSSEKLLVIDGYTPEQEKEIHRFLDEPDETA